MTTAIEVRDLRKSYGDMHAVRGVSFGVTFAFPLLFLVIFSRSTATTRSTTGGTVKLDPFRRDTRSVGGTSA